jgi:hypothetical protein
LKSDQDEIERLHCMPSLCIHSRLKSDQDEIEREEALQGTVYPEELKSDQDEIESKILRRRGVLDLC